MVVYLTLICLTIISTMLPLGVIILRKQIWPPQFRWLLFLLWISLLADLATFYYPQVGELVKNIYNLTQFVLLCIVFRVLTNRAQIRRLTIVLLLIYLIIFVSDFAISKTINDHIPLTRAYSSLVFIFLSIYYFGLLLDSSPSQQILRFPSFWLTCAILVYFAGNIVLYFSLLIAYPDNLYYIYIPIHSFFAISKNILFAYSAYIAKDEYFLN